MRISFEIDTADLTDADRAILRAIGGATQWTDLGYVDETAPEQTAEDQGYVPAPADGAHPPKDAPADPPKRKRRTKAEMEAARAAEPSQQEAHAEAVADAQGPTTAEPVQQDAPEPEAVSEAPTAAEEDTGPVSFTPDARTIDKFREEAVAKASAALANGDRASVKAALDAVGAKRVSELADDQLATFIAALSS
jgi:hypothetical protein